MGFGTKKRIYPQFNIIVTQEIRARIASGDTKLLAEVLEDEILRLQSETFANPSFETFQLNRGVLLAFGTILRILQSN
jgi:hypothetical protein